MGSFSSLAVLGSYFLAFAGGTRISAPVTHFTSVMESYGRLMASCIFRMDSSSGPDMKQNALPSSKLTWAACPMTRNSSPAFSSESKLSEELFLREHLCREAALRFVVRVDEIFH